MRNRRQEESTESTESARGFRLRHLLFVGVVFSVGYVLYPRAEAAWQLHDQATHFANYGSCMVGPTGPAALRDDPGLFYAMMRRRLLISNADSAPFEDCASVALKIGGPEFERLHTLTASAFDEYAGKVAASASLAQMQVSAQYLSALAERAWPFVRSGYAQLVKPSSHAKEAPHPLEFERPALGSGLPSFRAAYHATWSDRGRLLLALGHSANLQVFESADSGLNWQPTSLSQPGIGTYAGRCTHSSERRAFAFEAGEDGIAVISLSGDEAIFRKTLSALSGLVNADCDGASALLVGPTRGGQNGLFVCRHAGNCGQVRVPPEWLEGQFDIARVSGVNVIATAHEGVVRVRTTRDEGASWTPPTVAFDYYSYPNLPTAVKVPTRLLSVGTRLYLHGVGKRNESYPVLYSDDLGASFRGASVVSAGKNTGTLLGDTRQGSANPIGSLGAR